MKTYIEYKSGTVSIESKDVIIIKDGYIYFLNNDKMDRIYIEKAKELIIEEKKEY